MTEPVFVNVTCPCSRKEEFEITLQAKVKTESPVFSIVVFCPFSCEKECHKNLSVQLKADPNEPGILYRKVS